MIVAKIRVFARFIKVLLTKAAVAIIVLCIFGLTLIAVFLHYIDPQWTTEIQAATTIVLVFATSIYAFFTFQTVRLLSDSPGVRLAAQLEGVHELLGFLHETLPDIETNSKLFPFAASVDGIETLDRCIKVFNNFSEKLFLIAMRQTPSITRVSIAIANESLVIVINLEQIRNAIDLELTKSVLEARPWTEVGASLEFQRISDNRNWLDALKGGPVDRIVADLEQLRSDCWFWVQFDVHPTWPQPGLFPRAN